jgi:hypothetical protein
MNSSEQFVSLCPRLQRNRVLANIGVACVLPSRQWQYFANRQPVSPDLRDGGTLMYQIRDFHVGEYFYCAFRDCDTFRTNT